MGRRTCLKSPSLLQHLGLAGATGPHSGSRVESHSPLVQLGMRARRRRRHIAHLSDRAAVALVSYYPRSPYKSRLSQNLVDVLVVIAAGSST